jgi:hypothetical protein
MIKDIMLTKPTLGITQLCEHIIVAVGLVDDLLFFWADRHVYQFDVPKTKTKKKQTHL